MTGSVEKLSPESSSAVPASNPIQPLKISSAAQVSGTERTTIATEAAAAAQIRSASGSCASTLYICPTRKSAAPKRRTPRR